MLGHSTKKVHGEIHSQQKFILDACSLKLKPGLSVANGQELVDYWPRRPGERSHVGQPGGDAVIAVDHYNWDSGDTKCQR